MHDTFAKVAEFKIREAIEKGELKDLPGAGKPIIIENMAFVPEEERLAYIIMKNSGLVPNEVSLLKEIESLEKAIDECQDMENKYLLKKRLGEISIRYRIIMEKRSKR